MATVNCQLPALFVSKSERMQLDNLKVMQGINTGCVDLIVTDIPYSPTDYFATVANNPEDQSFTEIWKLKKKTHIKGLEDFCSNNPRLGNLIRSSIDTHSRSMGAFLFFMAVRLLEMHRLLREGGSIYLQCDSTVCHYLKTLMDAIFGASNFRSHITWLRTRAHDASPSYGNVTEVILFYGPHICKYNLKGISVPLSDMDKSLEKKEGLKGKEGFVEKYYDSYRLHRRTYWEKVPANLFFHSKGDRHSYQNVGYPMQKPTELYELLIKASSSKNDLVLDPFCGTGSTCVAAQKLGRRWIAADIWPGSLGIINRRLGNASFTTSHEAPARTDGGEIGTEPQHTDLYSSLDDDEYEFMKRKMFIFAKENLLVRQRERYRKLLDREECYCEGCGLVLPHFRYLEVCEKDCGRLDASDLEEHYRNEDVSGLALVCHPCLYIVNIHKISVDRIKSHLRVKEGLPENHLTISGRHKEDKWR